MRRRQYMWPVSPYGTVRERCGATRSEGRQHRPDRSARAENIRLRFACNGNGERDCVEEPVNDHSRVDAVDSAAQIRKPEAERREEWKRVDQAVGQCKGEACADDRHPASVPGEHGVTEAPKRQLL